jgi:hypothetical protein
MLGSRHVKEPLSLATCQDMSRNIVHIWQQMSVKIRSHFLLGTCHGHVAVITSYRLKIRRMTLPYKNQTSSENCYFLCVISISYTTLMLKYILTDVLAHHTSHTSGMDTFFISQRFFLMSHTDSPFVGASGIGQRSILQ